MQPILSVPVIAFASFALTGCSGTEAPSNGSNSAVDAFVEAVAAGPLTESVQSFSAATEDLSSAADALCAKPGSDALEAARQAWRDAACAWYQVSLFNFGPWDADPVLPLYSFVDSLRVRGDDYRETVRSSLAAWLASEDALDADFFQDQRFQYVGLLPLEILLFENDSLSSVSGEDARSCQILTGLAHELSGRAEELESGWLEDDGDTGKPFVERFVDGELPSGRKSFPQLIISGKEFTEYLSSRHVVSIAGQTSGTSWELMTCALDAVERLLTEDQGERSIVDLMRELDGEPSADAIEATLDEARTAIENEDEVAFEAALVELEGYFKADIPQVLGVDLGLTFTDGD